MADEKKSENATPDPDEGQSDLDDLVNELAALNEAGDAADAGPAPRGLIEEAGDYDPVSSDDIEALLEQAARDTPAAVEAVEKKRPKGPITEFRMPDLTAAAARAAKNNIEMIKDVHLHVRVELGRRKMYIEEILKLGPGSVVELDKLAGDPLDILVNNRLVARGEVLILNDNFCIRVTEIVKERKHDER